MKAGKKGVRGRNVAHANKIKNIGRTILGIMALLAFVTLVNAGVESIFAAAGVTGSIALAGVLPLFMVEGKFKELSTEDWATFKKDATAEQLAEYFNAKNENARTELKKLIDGKASAEDIKSLKDEISQTLVEQMKTINDALKQHGLMIKKLTEAEKVDEASKFSDVKKALTANIEKLKALKSGDKASANDSNFSIKVVGTMLESGNISGGNVPVEQRLSGLNTIATRKPRLLDLFTRGTATSPLISWVYQANRDGAAGGTAEGDTKNQIDFDLVVDSETVVKRTAFIKVSTEMMDDVDFIESEIRNELMRLLIKDIEGTAYSGNGAGTALNGIRTVSTAFVAGDFAAYVENPNQIDVLIVAMNQIAIAEQEPANYILMHPTDVTKLKVAKVSSTDKRYIDRLQLIAGQLLLDGVPIIQTTLVTAGEYLVGAFDLATLYDKGEISIEIGLDGNDFTKNLRTILAEWRGALVVRNNHRTAFVKGVFATDITAIDAAVV